MVAWVGPISSYDDVYSLDIFLPLSYNSIMNIEIERCIKIFADPEYHYEVIRGETQLMLVYKEKGGEPVCISFGSVQEMEAVANAMLQVVQVN